MAPPVGKKQMKVNHIAYAMMLNELLAGPCTAQELADASGLYVLTVNRWMRVMRKHKVAHVASWENDAAGRPSIAAYALGPGKDAPRRPKPASVKRALYRERQQAKLLAAASAGATPPQSTAGTASP